jgi:DNA-binding GntR family transcriptional regulator
MSPEPVAAERVYILLREALISGRFIPGATVVERVVALEYGVSVSPFRDAAQRLVGESLLEINPGGGYRTPLVTEESLRDLYRWHSHLVRLVLKAPTLIGRTSSPPISIASDPGTVAIAATELFRSLARSCANREYGQALAAATDRLHAARLREGRVLKGLRAELETVRMSTTSGSDSDRFQVHWAYHRRRIRRVGKIVETLYVN